MIQEHGLGDYQILVQLPGVDDPARVKEIMQSTAMLEIKQSLGGPYPARKRHCRTREVFSSRSELLPGKSIGTQGGDNGPVWYLVSRAAAVTGRDLRDAEPSRDENGTPSVAFNLTNEGGNKFASFTGAHVGDNLAVARQQSAGSGRH